MFTFLLVLQAIIAAALVGVILIQRSEGGGLGMGGGSPTGLMSARGAADFLTRTTTVLACIFVGLSIALAAIASVRHGGPIDTSLARQGVPVTPAGPTGASPTMDTLPAGTAPAAAPVNSAAPAPASSDVPLAQ